MSGEIQGVSRALFNDNSTGTHLTCSQGTEKMMKYFPQDSKTYSLCRRKVFFMLNSSLLRRTELTNKSIALLSEEIRYWLARVDTDCMKNVGIMCTRQNLLQISAGDVKILTNAGWVVPYHEGLILNEHGDLNFCILLKILLGLVKEYMHILMNVKHELISYVHPRTTTL